MKIPTIEKDPQFGHTSFIKVVINGTSAQVSHQVSHEGLLEADYNIGYLKYETCLVLYQHHLGMLVSKI